MGFWDSYWREETEDRPEPGTPEDLGDMFNWEFWFLGVPGLIAVVAGVLAFLGAFN